MKQMIAYLEKHTRQAWVLRALQVVIASLLLALLGQVKISLPFSPVPIVLQSKLILVIGALLGARRGLAAVLLFLLYGAFGWPVFSSGTYGYLSFIGPTGGYILAYPLAAYVVGFLVKKGSPLTSAKLFLSYCAGMFGIVYPIGCLQLSFFVGLQKAFAVGAMPFALTDLCSFVLLTAATITVCRKLR